MAVIQFVAPNVASISQPFGVANIYGRWLLEQMAVFADLFNVIVATMKGAHDALAGNGLQPDVLRYKQKAMSQLRGRLTAVDDGAILTIIFLALLEEAMADRAAFNVHRRQVTSMIAARGGIKNLKAGTGIRATVTQFETWNSPETKPAVHCTYQHSPSAYRDLPEGFRHLADARLLSLETIRIMNRITHRQRWSIQDSDYRAVDKSVYGDPFPQHELYFKDFREACPALNHPDGLEKLVCLAMIRFCVNRSNRERPRACVFHSLSVELTQKLPSVIPSDVAAERQALLWVWLMAIDSWSVGERQIAPEGAYLLKEMSGVFPETERWSIQDLEQLGARFFWTANIGRIVERNWGRAELVEESSRFVAISYRV